MSTLTDLQYHLHRAIPITQTMGIQVSRLDESGLELFAPLALHLNDKQTAFGGSLASIMTVTGWALTHALLQRVSASANILVYKTEIAYLQPVTTDIRAWCQLPDKAVVEPFLAQFFQRGKARWTLQVQVFNGEQVAVELVGNYLALKTGV
ncbi:thioesterase-like protein [Beggiatoa alba B18LD]|uniref:Thioesterase-like protein n=1 Tax=Beggiatoa alba B18LD TaxID=395493 RepID=I3CF73_9GAMM|nr:YiiD C-terminal domain-containing protein [Beggiatoa alba]EIJ42266.1 thioesterase-like protein [Beggiatoa alba B18LD]